MRYLLLTSIIALIASCGILIEDDLTTQKVDLLSPPNGYNSSVQTQNFVWDSLPGAIQYRFQLVSKRFDFIEDYTKDTLLTTTSISLALAPKQYQWKVIGINNAGESDATIYDLNIAQDTTLANQVINAIAPSSGANYTTDSVAFLWSLLPLANQYQLQVATSPTFNSQTITTDTTTANDFIYLINDLGLGTYYYRIRAMRVGQDTTLYNTTQQFKVDMTPIHQQPSNNSTPTLPLNISWRSSSNLARDSLYLYYNNTTSPFQVIALSNKNYTFNNTDTTGRGAGVYYWQVKSISNNGVESSSSNFWQFSIN
jgi:hypothetical protein